MDIRDLIFEMAVGESIESKGIIKNRFEEVFGSLELKEIEKTLNNQYINISALLASVGMGFTDCKNLSEEDILKEAELTPDIINSPDAIDDFFKICIVAAFICKKMSIPKSVGYDTLRIWIYHKIKGNDKMATLMFKQIAIQLFIVVGDEVIPSILGSSGGRPQNRHKESALAIAKQKWESMEYASINVVASAVKHQLDKRYTDSPSLPTIKKWLNDPNIRPKRSA